MAVRIIVDSTADMKAAVKERVAVVPLTVHFGEEEYIDGVTINHKVFYEKLEKCDVLPTTSQATPASFGAVYETVVEAGDTAVVLTIASSLSGTYQSAVIAADDFPGKIFVVDSQSATIGAGILAELALQMVDRGMDAESIAKELEQAREHIHIVAVLDTLEYLKKGGRISAAVAFAGSLLSIKPVIGIENGQIKMLGKARGTKQGNALLMQEIAKLGGVDFTKPLQFGFTGLSDSRLCDFTKDSMSHWQEKPDEKQFAPIGSVIGTHAGPGAFAVAFFKRK